MISHRSRRSAALAPASARIVPAVIARPVERTSPLAVALLAAATLGAVGCNKIPEPEPKAATQPLTQPAPAPTAPEPTPEPAPAPAPAAETKSKGSSDFIGYPKEGWTKVKLHDTLPLCVFSDMLEREKAQFLDQAKKQTLKSDETVVFGAFGPGCVSEDCDDLPTLQCMVDREGDTLIVRANYIGYHKDGTHCTDNCRPVTAGCETPKLEQGTYSVRYGDSLYTLKIPSVMKSPCLKTQ